MLSPIQKEIVEESGNLIVRASAGTGKTHTMVSKIVYDIEYQHTHKVVAAITFTIKAANEIKERMTIDTADHFIGTNNSFAIEEIIKPFMKDVFGMEYKLDMSTDYSTKVNTFAEGVVKIKDEQILCSYRNSKENFIFQLALDILKKSKACQLYLQAKYFKIYVDEYQDCDKDMHALFMYICEILRIDTFVVGDEKQSIYMWRGAYPKAFMSIWDRPDFSKKFMRDNFRSCQQIQNYSNLLCNETRDLYKPVNDLSSIIMVCATAHNWVSSVIPYLDTEKKCALLRYSNADSSKGLYLPSNGIALCRDMHWAFDKGMFTIDDNFKVIVHPEVESNYLKKYNRKSLFIPENAFFRPDINNLHYHQTHIYGLFKTSGSLVKAAGYYGNTASVVSMVAEGKGSYGSNSNN